MSELKKLFSKTKIGTMELKNRLCMGEIAQPADKDGNYAPEAIDFYVERAKGG